MYVYNVYILNKKGFHNKTFWIFHKCDTVSPRMMSKNQTLTRENTMPAPRKGDNIG